MKRVRIVAACSLITAGVLVMAYPYLFSFYYEQKKTELLTTWVDLHTEENVPKEDVPKENVPKAPTSDNQDSSQVLEGVWVEDTNVVFDLEYAVDNMAGIVSIPAIRLQAPILIDDTEKNLNISICQLKNSSKMGDTGNYILAGHKSRIYGRHFNRLSELRVGDAVELSDGENTYYYTVFDKVLVKETDTWVLDSIENESTVTLITCDYSVKPIGRLVVRCKLIPIPV